MLIPENRVEKALTVIANTDAMAAELHMKVERAEYRAKAVKDAVFLRIEGNSVAERQARAGASDEYAKAMEEYFTALQAYDALKNERALEFLVIEVYRTLSANQRRGNV